MIDTTTARLAEPNMTRARILGQITAPRASRPVRPAPQPRPPVVCLCGSTRFVDEFNRQRKRLTYDGQIVLSIEIVTTQGYTGPSAQAEIRYAHATGKPVRYLEPPEPATYCDCGHDDCAACTDPSEWACRRCRAAWYGTPPQDRACPTGCHPAA